MVTYAFDIESYYDKDFSLETFGNWNYLAHPATDIYLMAVAGENGFRWCGRPEEFDWSLFNGEVRVVSHNFAFDGCLFGLLGHPLPGDYNCTSHLAAYCGSPRSLKDAAQHLLGREVSKDLRTYMKGRRWQELSTERQNELADYCQRDAELSLELWQKCADRWPPNEQELSRQTIRMGWLGVRIDRARLVEYLARATAIEQESTSRLPWDAPVRSLKHARAHCQRVGIPAPESFNQKNARFLAWEREYGEDHPFIAARRDCHKANLILRKLEAMQRRIKPDGRLNYNLRYGGAHTLRWSGSDGCNLQNLPRAAWNGIDLRSLLVPEPGKKFIVCDLSAIEPRVLTWLVGDQPLLKLLAQGLAIYEAQALAWGLWQGTPGSFKDSEPALYLFIKSLSLGCGYGMGPRRFRDICTMQGIELSEREAVARIALYRKHNPKVVQLWRRLDRELGLRRRYSFAETVLPSGRKLRYTGLTWKKGSYCAMIQDHEKGWRETRLWGGVLTENIVSAIARDIFSEALLRLERAGIRVVLHAHSATNQALADEVAKSRDEILRQSRKRSLALKTINLTPVEFVARLFRSEDIVWIGRKTSSGKKVHATNFRSITHWQRLPPHAVAWSYTTGCTFKPGSYSRCSEAVQERIYLVLESDELSIKDTVAMFGWAQKVFGLKLMAIVFSGGSSVHGWFFAPAEDWIGEFKPVLVAAGFCSGPLHLAQPVRLGGARRENGNLQTVLWLHPSIV